jgi:hypothetical protein
MRMGERVMGLAPGSSPPPRPSGPSPMTRDASFQKTTLQPSRAPSAPDSTISPE